MTRIGRAAWGKREARWYSEALGYSDYPEKILGVMAPILRNCSSLLDVGAGCGALSLPLAGLLDDVVALDPSAAMIEELRQKAAADGIENVRTETAAWDEAEDRLRLFDAVLCANVPNLLDRPSENIPRLERHAFRYVFLVLGTPKNANKFYFRQLWPLVYGRSYPARKDYFGLYKVLYRMGIFANVAIVDYSFDQPFRDLEEAVVFWKHHLRLRGGRLDETIREFLSTRLADWGGRLWASIPKQSAVVWWQPRQSAN